MKGKLIKDPFVIVELAKQKKCVVIDRYGSVVRQPAAFVRNWQFGYLMNLIIGSRVYEYKKQEKK